MGKENNLATTNACGSTNNKRPLYRKQTNTSDGDGSTSKVVVREMKFHPHDSEQRKTSESFARIKKAIVSKIQKTFEDPIAIAKSIVENKKKVFKKTGLKKVNQMMLI